MLPSLHKMQTLGLATDTLVTVGEQGPWQTPLLAHSLVLAAASPALAKILATCRDKEITLILPGLEREEVEGVLEDIYLGRERAGVFLKQWGLLEEDSRVNSDDGGCLEELIENKVSLDQTEWKQDLEARVQILEDPFLKMAVKDSLDLENGDMVGEKAVLAKKRGNKRSKSKVLEPKCIKKNKLVKKLPNGGFECAECSKLFGNYTKIKDHIRKVHDVNYRKCNECQKIVRSYRFKRHTESHTNSDKTFDCDKCAFSTLSHSSNYKHKKSHLKTPKSYCDKCEKSFKNKNILKNHIRDKHSGNVYMCDECDFTCTGPTLATHKQMKHGPSSLICPFCDFTTMLPQVLEEHKKGNHYSRLLFSSKNKSSEKVRKEREAQMNFSCTICKTEFKSRQTLGLHIQTKHQGIRFNCPENECKFVANQKGSLKIHLNAVHLGITKNCKLCDYRAGQATHLRKHMMIKHNASPFSCSSCPYRCQSSERMQRHIIKMH